MENYYECEIRFVFDRNQGVLIMVNGNLRSRWRRIAGRDGCGDKIQHRRRANRSPCGRQIRPQYGHPRKEHKLVRDGPNMQSVFAVHCAISQTESCFALCMGETVTEWTIWYHFNVVPDSFCVRTIWRWVRCAASDNHGFFAPGLALPSHFGEVTGNPVPK